ncbi:hypothetical protein QR680_013181 [Steinernema hermaphroditum]|uniref:Uncharacterized protein n=1 Tax=Steinernema hermaphroditum TaxID=289476 RepID=A0AA39I4M5_9BILA|nr:hypothetical protein QR680_013181 [Steinernema hermaphroditum]
MSSEPEAKRPRLIDVADHVRARVAQIAELLEVVDNSALVSREVTAGPRTALQRLPRHMRRRAMSYNLKRLPRCQRGFAASAVAKSKHRKKPPSRFWRRRPNNLLANYARRQREVVWLETHIWHAKRFHMKPMWGYKIPSRSFQRNFRPTYRDSMRHASVRDHSFLRCLEIVTSSQSRLIELLAPLSAPGVAPSFAFKMGLEGKFEISTVLYEPDQFPCGCLGPVKFLWVKRNEEYALILWIHPANWNPVFKALSKLLNAAPKEELKSNAESTPNKINLWKIQEMKVNAKTYECRDGIKVVDNRDQLNRFRLYGPQSLSILSKVLATVAKDENGNFAEFRETNAYWDQNVTARSPAEYLDGVTFSILVEDPRLTRPPKKTLPGKNSGGRKKPVTIDGIPLSPLQYFWDTERRETLLRERVSNDKLNKMRSERLAPILTSESKIPIVVVIRSSGTGKANPYDGVEVVIPGGFGMDFWIALQFGTAHAASLKDQKSFDFEANRMSFPYDIPDCAAGLAEEKSKKEKSEQKYLRRPHNRRIKYWSRLSVKYPFEYAWPDLLRSWSTEADDVSVYTYVLRDRTALVQIQKWLSGKAEKPEDVFKVHGDVLIPVRIEASSRGCPKQFAMICEPMEDDLREFKEGRSVAEPSRSRKEDASGEVEMKDAEESEQEEDGFMTLGSRNEKIIPLDSLFPDKIVMGKKKKKEKKVDMRRKAKERKKLKEIGLEMKKEDDEESHESASADYKDSCLRRVMGRIVRGDYSFTDAKGRGLGYCTLRSLEATTKGNVLFRNTSSKYYHLGKLSVLLTLPSL